MNYPIRIEARAALARQARNKIKRRLREISRLNAYKIKDGYDIICIVRVNAKDIDYQTLNFLEPPFSQMSVK